MREIVGAAELCYWIRIACKANGAMNPFSSSADSVN